MNSQGTLPSSPLERAKVLQNMLISEATGGSASNSDYCTLRREFMDDMTLQDLLPKFVRTSRDLAQFWQFIKFKFQHYAERREFIWDEFRPLLNALEGKGQVPSDNAISEAFASLDCEVVSRAWAKALERRTEDPEGAITASRTLLEAVCKRILDDLGITHTGKEDFSELYKLVAKELRLAPENYPEKNFKAILSSCQGIVNHLATLRNGLSDAHAPSRPVRPLPRHAALAVNLAGTMASFLVETWQARKAQVSNLKTA